jgi:hypothetical protein
MNHATASKFYALAVPLFAALGCTATINGDGDDGPMNPVTQTGGTSGASTGGTGAGGSSASGGTGTGGTGTGGTGTGGTGTGGTSGEPGMEPETGPRPVGLVGQPIYSRFVRLTNDQWENTVRDILRLSAPTGVSDNFLDAVAGTTDFDNNERVLFVDNTSANDFQLAAEKMADQVTATDAALQAVVATTDPTVFIRTFGRRAFRRELTDAEVSAYRAIHDEGSLVTDGNQSAFTKGANWVIATMLQSPHFLYRVEFGDVGAPLDGYEMAAKLSFWIRDTAPTDTMLDTASAFATADGAVAQATQMLEDTAALAVMRKFHGALHKFALFDSIAKTGVAGYSSAMNPEFTEASFLFFDRIFSQNLGVRDILTTTVGFVGPNTASIYGVAPSGTGITQMDLPGRVGFFSQAAFLALWARNNEPGSITRGARLNLDVLCADPGLPVDVPAIPPAEAGETNREIITNLTSACARVCHGELINPLGFAFENFDGVGRYRDTDNGEPVDTAAQYPFHEGRLSFAGAPELMEHMAAGTQAHQCWAKKMTSYALSRDVVETDRPLVESLGQVSRDTGASLKQVMLALIRNDAFRLRSGGAL